MSKKSEHKARHSAKPTTKSAAEWVKETLSAGVAVPDVTKEQVLEVIKHSKGLCNNILRNLLAVDISQCFPILQCNNIKELIEKYFDGKYKSIHHNLKAAHVAYSIGGSELIGKYPDDAMRAMSHLNVEQRKAVYKKIIDDQKADSSKKVTFNIKLVKKAIEKHYPHLRKKEKSDGSASRNVTEKQADKYFESLFNNPDKAMPTLAATIKEKLRPDQLIELIKLIQASEHEVLIKEGL